MYQQTIFNALPNGKFFDFSERGAFIDITFQHCLNDWISPYTGENIVKKRGKLVYTKIFFFSPFFQQHLLVNGDNNGYRHFLPCQQSFNSLPDNPDF